MCPLWATINLIQRNSSLSTPPPPPPPPTPSSLHPWKGNSSPSAVESSYGIRTTEAWLALNEGTNCSAKEEGGGPAASSGTWELAPEQRSGVKPASPPCEQERCVNFCLVPLSPSSSKWSTSATLGERAWPGVGAERWVVVGVGEHLTQAPFVLRAGVCITMEFGGGQLQTAVREMGRVCRSNTRGRPYCWSNYHSVIIMLTHMIICVLIWGHHLVFIFYSVTIHYALSCHKQEPALSLLLPVKHRCN